MSRKHWWWLGAVCLLALVAVQVRPCTEGTAGCSGEDIGTDGVEWCDDWVRAYAQTPAEVGINLAKVEVARVLAELSSVGVTVEPELDGSGEPAWWPDYIERREAAVLSHAETEAEPIELVLDLGDLPFPELEQLRAMEPEARARVLAERKALIEREQRDVRAFLDQLGAVATNPVGLLNHIQAWIPPGRVLEVLGHPDVKDVYPSWQSVFLLYDQEELRRETFLCDYWDLGIKGESSSRTCEPGFGFEDIKIAIIEPSVASMFFPNRINSSHPGWRDCRFDSCESRIRSELKCSFSAPGADPCRPWTEAPQTMANHGTWVASIAAGDITQEQDVHVAEAIEQRRRSGIAPEASILYFNVDSTGFVAAAVATAFLMGADVINLSLAVSECARDPQTDCGGLGEVVKTVTRSGSLVVAAAGNENNASGRCDPGVDCSVCYPAVRPEVVSVGNVETASGVDYDLAEIAESSSRGEIRVGIGGRYASRYPNGVAVPAVSVAAPGNVCGYFSNDDSYDDVGRSGTSFAAPVVAAGAGLIREEFGPELWDARMLRAHLLAMGDGSGVEEAKPGAVVGMSRDWGAGRLKFHAFDTMRSPKGIGHRSFRIHEGQLAVLGAADMEGEAFDPAVTQWKMGLYADWSDLSAIPYLLVTYWDICERPTMIAADLAPGLERHAVLDGAAVDQACLQVRVYGYSVPAGGVEVFITDYYHSGDPSEH